MNVCIVTPELAGLHKNGGIGTFCRHLCELLGDDGHTLTILFSGEADHNDWAQVVASYQQKGVCLQNVRSLLDRDPFGHKAPNELPPLRASRRIADHLEANSFDLVHFQDWKANGFHAIRRKRSGLGLEKTRLLLTLHSPSKWLRQGMSQAIADPVAELTLDFAERYACENADLLIAPTRHMLEWAESAGWRIQARCKVLPYPLVNKGSLIKKAREIDRKHLIFFGRLETRKGLQAFLDGFEQYLSVHAEPEIREITFLGKPGQHQGQIATQFLRAWSQSHPGLTVHFETGHDTVSALNYIRESSGVAILPSLLDNCPFAALECIEHELPFLAARSGGIKEIVDPQYLFEPDAPGIAHALSNLGRTSWAPTHPYEAIACNRRWRDLHQAPGSGTAPEFSKMDASQADLPKVSVCIPYYELPGFLPQALESIRRNTYPNLQVVVCDDGSATDAALETFRQMSVRHEGLDWIFLQQSNQGVGFARNRAAQAADGDYLVFMDADNLAEPDMIASMVQAMQSSGADALTCEFKAFASPQPPHPRKKPDYFYRPLGAVPLLCLLDNTFGDANCIVKRAAFEAVDGFGGPPLAAYADWDFFLRLHLAGFRLDVIPSPLFWYRHRQDSMLRENTARDDEHAWLLQRLLAENPQVTEDFAAGLTAPLFRQLRNIEKKVGRDAFHQLKQAPVPWHKHIYRRYRRLLGDPRYQKKSIRL